MTDYELIKGVYKCPSKKLKMAHELLTATLGIFKGVSTNTHVNLMLQKLQKVTVTGYYKHVNTAPSTGEFNPLGVP